MKSRVLLPAHLAVKRKQDNQAHKLLKAKAESVRSSVAALSLGASMCVCGGFTQL